jgi:hypothetical protein
VFPDELSIKIIVLIDNDLARKKEKGASYGNAYRLGLQYDGDQ